MKKMASTTSCGSTTRTSVYAEIEQGLKYRKTIKKRQIEQEVQKRGRKKKRIKTCDPCAKIDDLFVALNAGGTKRYPDPFKEIRREAKRCQRKKLQKNPPGKPVIVNRDFLTRREHINLLAQPRAVPQQEPRPAESTKFKKKRKKGKKCMEYDDPYMTPRLKHLAMPTKRLVYANWTRYQDVLDPASVVRMENILTAGKGQSLDVKEATKYFKCKDKKRKRKLKRSRCQKKQERLEEKWLDNEVNILADLLVHDIAKGPLEAENNRHLQLTNTLITTLKYKGYKVGDLPRNTHNVRKKAILEILDHVSVWSNRIFQRAEVLDLEVNVRRYGLLRMQCV